MGLVLVAGVLVLGAGCRGGGSGKNGKEKTARRKSSRKSVRTRVLRSGQLPRDLRADVARLLNDLASGDIRLAWRAEEELGRMGARVAPQVRLMLDSASPEARAAACRLAYRFEDKRAIAPMIDLLADESRLVRAQAGVSLSGMTEQDFDFRPDALASDRAKAIGRWQDWYLKTYGNPRHAFDSRRRRR
jgi:hypothetical protein